MRPLRILTWPVHGSYLWYLSHVPHELYLPVKPGGEEGYGGRGATFPLPDRVKDVPVEAVPDLDLDCVLFQSHRQWLVDQHEILSPAQRRLPRVFVEHDPPRRSPTDTHHPVDDPDVLLVHVTAFNDLMWDSGRTPTRVVDHGVVVPDGVRWTGELERGLVVVNHLARRGRRLGADLVERVRRQVPLDLIGMGYQEAGGQGEVDPPDVAAFASRYRFFFHPARYTSLGLAVIEAMTIGMPVVGLATTELVTVIENGVSGWISTDVDDLVDRMRHLLRNHDEARRLGEGARRTALSRFSIDRFVADWNRVLAEAVGAPAGSVRVAG